MPDISRLQELCTLLHISFEELVGERNAETNTIKKMMSGENENVSLSDMANVAPIIQPEQIEEKAKEAIDNSVQIERATLINLAPFMDEDDLEALADHIIDFDMGMFTSLAPFLNADYLDRIIDKAMKNGHVGKFDMSSVCGLAPFLDGYTLDKIVVKAMEEGWLDEAVTDLAPFLDGTTIKKIINYLLTHDRGSEVSSLSIFM